MYLHTAGMHHAGEAIGGRILPGPGGRVVTYGHAGFEQRLHSTQGTFHEGLFAFFLQNSLGVVVQSWTAEIGDDFNVKSQSRLRDVISPSIDECASDFVERLYFQGLQVRIKLHRNLAPEGIVQHYAA